MSYLRTLIDFIETLRLKDQEVNNLLKEIDEISNEAKKHENQLEEYEREHMQLQIEYHNLETTASFYDVSAIKNLNTTSQKMYKDCVELKSLIDKIDFKKILQCNHMEMEAKCRTQWQPIEDCFAKTLNWHQKMEQRHIVQRYRQSENIYREVEDTRKTQLKAMEESLKQSVGLINQAKDKRNNMLIVLIEGSEDLNNLNKKMIKLNQYQQYIEGLRQEKIKIKHQLDQSRFKAFSPMLNTNNSQKFALTAKQNEQTFNFIMPKFPSFSDILESFNQAEIEKVVTKGITTINDPSTSSSIKSILHTTKTSITTKQTKNVHFKVELEEYQKEITDTEAETDVEELPPKTSMEINEGPPNDGENLEEMKDVENSANIEIIDLLTPAENTEKIDQETEEITGYSDDESNTKQIASKTTLDIQECVIFKTPFPIEELKYIKDKNVDKENNSNSGNLNNKPSADTCPSSSSHQDINEILNTTKMSFCEDSSSSPTSLKNVECFDNLLNDNNDGVFLSKDSKEETQVNTGNYSSEIQDFLDFGSNRGFAFDSDDNIGNNYKLGSMDFM